MQDYSKQIAEHLLNCRAIQLSPDKPFIWASGWNSPIYCDNRITLSFPEIRSEISSALIEKIKSEVEEFDYVAGVATAGIPQASIIADRLNKPLIYVRPSPKSHGMKNQIEGKMEKNCKCIVIEDLISTGGSSIKAVDVLRNEGAQVLGLFAIFTYGFPASKENFEKANLKYHYLSDYDQMLKQAIKRGDIREEQIEELSEWRKDPSIWKK